LITGKRKLNDVSINEAILFNVSKSAMLPWYVGDRYLYKLLAIVSCLSLVYNIRFKAISVDDSCQTNEQLSSLLSIAE